VRRFLFVACALLMVAGCAESVGPGGPRASAGGLSFNDGGSIGSLGPALLDASVTQAVIEIDTGRGTSPDDAQGEAMRVALERFGGKTKVEFSGSDEVPADQSYTQDALRQLEADHRQTHSRPGLVSIYILVLPGESEDENALGETFGASSIAIFPERIEGVLATLNRGGFERAVMLHELGHLFGLVNITNHGGFHEDPDHPGHSRNRDSVMYWAVEDLSVANVFRGGPPTDFDEEDQTEITRIRDAA
jgi:hypothetical protein